MNLRVWEAEGVMADPRLGRDRTFNELLELLRILSDLAVCDDLESIVDLSGSKRISIFLNTLDICLFSYLSGSIIERSTRLFLWSLRKTLWEPT
jgi:hypothetical protein